MTAYYVRADGTAATYDVATGPTSSAAACMSLDTLNNAGDVFSAGDIIYFSDNGGVYTDSTAVGGVDAAIHPQSSGDTTGYITYKAAPGDSPSFTPPSDDYGVHFISGLDYLWFEGLSIESDGATSGTAFYWLRDVGGNTSGSAGDGYTIRINKCTLTGQGALDPDAISCNENGQVHVTDTTITNYKGNICNALTAHNPNGTGAKLKAERVTITNCDSYVTPVDTSLIQCYNCTMTGGTQGSGVPPITCGGTSGSRAELYDCTISHNESAGGFFQTSNAANSVFFGGCTLNLIGTGISNVYGDAVFDNCYFDLDGGTSRIFVQSDVLTIVNSTLNVAETNNAFLHLNTTGTVGLVFEGNHVLKSDNYVASVDDLIRASAGSTLSVLSVSGNVFNEFPNMCLNHDNATANVVDICNNTFYKCTYTRQLDFAAAVSTTTRVYNNQFYQCQGTSAPIIDATAGVDQQHNNYFECTNDGTDYSEATATALDPCFTNAAGGDFSPCAAALQTGGVKWWTGKNPEGYDQPIPSWDIPIGASQAGNYGPFHPVNLI